MPVDFLIIQWLNGLAAASSLFLAGLSIIFGVTPIVNVAQGSFSMLAPISRSA